MIIGTSDDISIVTTGASWAKRFPTASTIIPITGTRADKRVDTTGNNEVTNCITVLINWVITGIKVGIMPTSVVINCVTTGAREANAVAIVDANWANTGAKVVAKFAKVVPNSAITGCNCAQTC